jgi:crotonobetainyl-CoA:carnitine CoA-transferase CaiB-like acyl-CoA transferase
VIGREDWLEDERLDSVRGRFLNMPELVEGIDAALSQKGRDEWGKIFDENGIIWGPVLGLHEVVEDPQALAIGLFPELESDQIGTYRTVSSPIRFESAEVRPRGPAPRVGEHSREILLEAGLSVEEVDGLIDAKVVR